jgi:hypothetical protein
MAATPLRAVRISDEVWHAAREQATLNDETLTDVIRRSLIDYSAAAEAQTTPGAAKDR